jgi:hypothetical protein
MEAPLPNETPLRTVVVIRGGCVVRIASEAVLKVDVIDETDLREIGASDMAIAQTIRQACEGLKESI